jgi:hypothetical protein
MNPFDNLKNILFLIGISIAGICLAFGVDILLNSLQVFILIDNFKVVSRYLIFIVIIIHVLSRIRLINIDFLYPYQLKGIVFISAFLLSLGMNAAIRSVTDCTWFTIGGILPFSDSMEYYRSLLAWPADHLSMVNSWRPLNHIVNSFLFFLGGKTYLGFLLLRILLLSISFGFFCSALSFYLGPILGIVSMLFLINWTIPFSNTVLSEPNGVIFSLLGYAFLLHISDKNFIQNLLLSIFFLSIANILRPYNFIHPILFISILFFHQRFSIKTKIIQFIAISFASILLIVFLPKIIFNWIGHPNSVINGNTGYVVLGISRNTDWLEGNNHIKSLYPNIKENKIINQLAYEEAYKNFNANPSLTLQFFSKSIIQASRSFVINIFSQVKQLQLKSNRSLLFFLFLVFSLLVFVALNKTFSISFKLILILGSLSFFSFAPIVFFDGTWRITATLIGPFSMIIPSIIFLLTTLIGKTDSNQITSISESKINNSIAFLFLGFFCLSLIYNITTWFILPHQPKNNGFTMQIGEEGKPSKWIDFNTYQTSHQLIDQWYYHMEYGCGNPNFSPQKKYFIENANKINAIKVDSMLYFILPKENMVLTPLPNKDSVNKLAPKYYFR